MLLEVEALVAGYGGPPVLHELSLSVEAGESVCLIGANGAGKTTLMRALSGLLRPVRGRITLDGRDLASLPADDEEAIAELVRIKGIGRWSAEIYLLFAEGRPDIWPAGDLAVQEAVGRMLTLPARPSEKETREIGARWQPHRGAMAIFTWHAYTNAAL